LPQALGHLYRLPRLVAVSTRPHQGSLLALDHEYTPCPLIQKPTKALLHQSSADQQGGIRAQSVSAKRMHIIKIGPQRM
jgi:hypothetical protein